MLDGAAALPLPEVVAMTDVTALDGLATWAARYATSGPAVLPLHSLRDGRCTCGSDCKSPGKHQRPTMAPYRDNR